MCAPIGIDAGEIDFDPGRFRRGTQSLDGVAGAAVGADDSFLLGFGENIHHAFVALGPVAFGDAVHQADVEIVGAEFAAEAVEIGACSGRVAREVLVSTVTLSRCTCLRASAT